jgi:hypothetical protein
MNLLTRLHLLPRSGQRFGFWRTVLVYLVTVLGLLVVTNLLLSGLLETDPQRLVASLLLALPSLLVPILWNRAAVQAGAPGFLTVWASRIRAIASVAFVAGTMLALVLAVENRRAAKAWKAVEADLKSRGEPLGFAELVGPPIPAEQNFAEHPLMAGILSHAATNDARGNRVFRWTGQRRQQELTEALRFPEIPTPETKEGKKLRRTGPDLVALAGVLKTGTNRYRTSYNDPVTGESKETNRLFDLPTPPADMPAAQAVLFALEAKRPVFDQIADAVRRPGCQYAIRFDDGPNALLPHLAVHKSMAVQLRTRIAARIATGDTTGAAEDIETIFRLAEKLDGDPTLISYLVRVAVQTIGISGFWDGATAHAWSDAQLLAFQKRFDGIHQKDGLVRAFRGERLFGKTAFEMMRQGRLDPEMLGGDGNDSDPTVSIVHLLPTSWLLQNQVQHTRLMDGVTSVLLKSDPDRCIDADGSGTQMGRFEDAFLLGKGRGFRPYRILADMLTPAMARVHVKADRALTAARLASAVCALERHRLATGTYPASLAELAPRFASAAPVDPMDGKAFRYHRNDDGSFTLYGVGPNKADDNGVFEAKGGGGDLDWVWPPAHPTEERRLF